jgi:predicted RNA-binding Zn-ribbon protein involved in translation (DUF1610 family)
MLFEPETPVDIARRSTAWTDTRTWVSPFSCPHCGNRYLQRVERPGWMRRVGRLGFRWHRYSCSSCGTTLFSRRTPVLRTGSFADM